MTDARFPERLLADRRLLMLSAEEFRSYVMATLFAVSNRTDGALLKEELALIPRFNTKSVDKLLEVGLWATWGIGYLITDFDTHQTSRSELEVLENARKRDREKKARQRAAKSVPGDNLSAPSFTEGVSPGTNGRTAQAGKAGRDKEATEVANVWAVAPIGEGRRVS